MKRAETSGEPQKEAVQVSHITATADLDEYALGLKEENRLRADYKEWRRYQFIVVVRNDHPSVLVRDLGPATDFEGVPPIRIPSIYGEDTVAQLMELADEARGRHEKMKNRMAELRGESTLLETVRQMSENAQKLRKGASHMGRSGRMIQRDGGLIRKDRK